MWYFPGIYKFPSISHLACQIIRLPLGRFLYVGGISLGIHRCFVISTMCFETSFPIPVFIQFIFLVILIYFDYFSLKGPDVESTMQYLCSNNVAVPPGQVIYTGLLNAQGGYQTDCTISRLSDTKYLLVAPSAQSTHITKWVDCHLPSSIQLADVTSQYCILALIGPRSREVLKLATKAKLDNENFPYATVQVKN